MRSRAERLGGGSGLSPWHQERRESYYCEQEPLLPVLTTHKTLGNEKMPATLNCDVGPFPTYTSNSWSRKPPLFQ